MLETSVVLNYPARPPRRTADSALSTVRAAWNDFLGFGAYAVGPPPPPPPPTPALGLTRGLTAVLPVAALADKSVDLLYAFPSPGAAMPRLAAFALPSSVTLPPGTDDTGGELPPPRLVQFCTTSGDGTLTWGCALQEVEAAGPADPIPEPSDVAASAVGGETESHANHNTNDSAATGQSGGAIRPKAASVASSAAASSSTRLGEITGGVPARQQQLADNTGGLPARRQRLAVRSLVVLSKWPMVELQKTILKHVAANRDTLWPAPPAGLSGTHIADSKIARFYSDSGRTVCHVRRLGQNEQTRSSLAGVSSGFDRGC